MPEPTPRNVKERNTKEFLRIARERFEQGQAASEKQRKRVLDDLAFYAGGEKQWDAETLKNRQAQQGVAGMPPVPARPCLTINKVREPVHQVINQERQSDMGIQLVPADDWGELAPPVSEEEIELREGLVRRIQRESEAADARTSPGRLRERPSLVKATTRSTRAICLESPRIIGTRKSTCDVSLISRR